MVKKLSCVSYGSLKRFPHTFTNITRTTLVYMLLFRIFSPNFATLLYLMFLGLVKLRYVADGSLDDL